MDTFCVLPWFNKEIQWDQRETHCCLLPRHYDIEKIKKQMLNGEKPKECQKCWNLEALGLQSDRQLKNSTLDWFLDKDLQDIKKDAEYNKTSTIMLSLFTSYTCNATCVSCSARYSSSWSQLNHRTNPMIPIHSTKFVDLNVIQKKINFKELRMLTLIGGEPFYEKKNFELLNYLLELGNNTLFLSVVTNGSVTLTDCQKTVLSNFKNLNLCISIDGVGSVYEYLRFPLKWQNLLNNLGFYREITDNISANYTLSNLNILYHNETIEWFVQNKINYSNNPVYYPLWLQPRSLPFSLKQYLKKILSTVDYNTYIGSTHTKQDELNWEDCLTQIHAQDLSKGVKWQEYLPKLSQLIDS